MSRLLHPRTFLYLVFLASGFSGLIYESIWSHYLKLFLGHAAYAQTLVLVIFMGGMAIGAAVCARRSIGWRNALLVYALVEGIIGLLAFGFHDAFVMFTGFAYSSVIPSLDSATTVTAFKWISAALLILPQSILLGTTFPLMVTGILRRYPKDSGRTIATLYFANSLGAGVGVLVSGFVLIKELGLPGTIITAGVINIALAVAVGMLAIRRGESSTMFPGGSGQPQQDSVVWFRIMLGIALLTGMASFIYEIVWIRMLSLVLSSATHAFELMLSAFILGLAAGGLWIRKRLDQLHNPVRFLAIVQVIMGLLALATLPVYDQTFEWMQTFLQVLTKSAQSWVVFNVLSHLIALAVMLPATFCAGMTLPLITARLVQTGSGEKSIGAVYGANTIGAIAGVLFAVHIGLPVFGLKNLLAFGAAIDIAVGMGLLFWISRSWSNLRLQAVAGVVTIVFVASVGLLGLDAHKMASGVYRLGSLISPEHTEIVFHKDGKTSSVDFIQGSNGLQVLSSNGKPEASMFDGTSNQSTLDESTMIMAAVVPLAIHPQAKTVANIGFGSGLTTHTLLAAHWLKRVDTIEIEPAIIEAASRFGDKVERAYNDPRSVIHIDDAKTYFAAHGERYDIIISEPSNPWVSGVASLFSDEFYRLVTRYLNTEGVFVQWFQLYEIDLALVSTIVKALSRHFADFEIYIPDDTNMLIVASQNGPLPEPDEAVLKDPKLAAELAKIGIYTLRDFELRHLAGRRTLEPLMAVFRLPYNSDYYPVLDQNAGRERFLDSRADDLGALGYAPLPVLSMLDGKRPAWIGGNVTENIFVLKTSKVVNARAILRYLESGETNDRFRRLLAEYRVNAEFLRWHAKDCTAIADSDTLVDALVATATRVAPFVDPRDFSAMWDSLNWDECEPQLSTVQKSWVALIGAVGKRDAREMARYAESLLAMEGYADPVRYGYLLMAGMLGHLAQGDEVASRSLWNTYSSAIYGKSQLDLILLLLAAHSVDPEELEPPPG